MGARIRARLAREEGQTLIEMITTMAMLGFVMTAVATLFVAGLHAQTDMDQRFQAQQNARLALDGLRREIHCASGVTGTATSITITLGAYCPSYTGTASVTWCTKDTSGTTPYALWRYTGTLCSGPGRNVSGSLTKATVFTINPAGSGNLGSISVDLPVDLTRGDAKQQYRLQDDIVLRNTARP